MQKLIEHRVLILSSLLTILDAGLMVLHHAYGIGCALFVGALIGTGLMLRPPRPRWGQVVVTLMVDGVVIGAAWQWTANSPEALLFGVVACSFATIRLSPKLGLASFGLMLLGTAVPLYRFGGDEPYMLVISVLSVSCILVIQIAEVADKLRQYRRLSIYDDLTNLHNMRYFRYKMAEFFRDPLVKHISLCVIDLDKFKLVNDTLGHRVGDSVLQKAAQVMREAAQPWVLCRYGGEEFVISLPNASVDQAVEVAERVRVALATAHLCELQVTLSCGIAQVDVSAGTKDTLFDAADRALYEAKQARDSVHVYRGTWPITSEIAVTVD